MSLPGSKPSDQRSSLLEPEGIDVALVRRHVDKIDLSDTFNDLEHQRSLLRYLVEQRLAGRHDPASQTEIVGAKLAARSSTPTKRDLLFPDEQDVRSHMGRLRKSLLEYYRHEAPSEPFEIEIPKGKYIATFVRTTNVSVQGAPGATDTSPVAFWRIPARNHFFSGRDAYLAHLYEQLCLGHGPIGISGLPGIGKTEAAIEYAYRFQKQYRTAVWVNAESAQSILLGLHSLAVDLGLVEESVKDLREAAARFKQWLESNTDWLLIFDNCEAPDVISPYLFPGSPRQHCIVTTRLAATYSILNHTEPLLQLEPSEGSLLLLRRARLLPTNHDAETPSEEHLHLARQLVDEVAGLPLALAQAAAFIEEAQLSLDEYLHLYRTEGERVRAISGEFSISGLSVTKTFTLAFSRVEARNRAAADILKAAAFLAPESVPEEIFIDGVPCLAAQLSGSAGTPLSFAEALACVARFGLLHRTKTERHFSTHRLVQAVVIDLMDNDERCMWIDRLVKVLYERFPGPDWMHWRAAHRLLPHALAIAGFARDYNRWSLGLFALLNKVARYLTERAEYTQAERILRECLEKVEKTIGMRYQFVATMLSNLGNVCQLQGRRSEAELLLRHALEIRESLLGPVHRDVASSLNSLAGVRDQGQDYTEARLLYERALSIYEQLPPPNESEIATILDSLARLHMRDNVAQALVFCRRAIQIRQETCCPDDSSTVDTVETLAGILINDDRYSEAQPLLENALAIRERTVGPDHPATANCLSALAICYQLQTRFDLAEPAVLRAIGIFENVLGVRHPKTILALTAHAQQLRETGRESEAEQVEKEIGSRMARA